MDFKLTEQQIMMRDVVKRFVREEIVPVRAELDHKPDPKDGFSWDLLRKADKIGLRTLALPQAELLDKWEGGHRGPLNRQCALG